MHTFVSTLVGFLALVGAGLVAYAAAKGQDHSIKVERKRPGQDQ